MKYSTCDIFRNFNIFHVLKVNIICSFDISSSKLFSKRLLLKKILGKAGNVDWSDYLVFNAVFHRNLMYIGLSLQSQIP